MKRILFLVVLLGLLTPAYAQRAYQLGNLPTLASNSLFITTVDNVGGGSRNTTYDQLRTQLNALWTAEDLSVSNALWDIIQAIPGGGDMVGANNGTDFASLPTVRSNIGAHIAGNITSGTLNPARLPSLPASQTTNFAATVGTLNALGSTNVYGIGARNIKGRDALRLWTAVNSNKPVRFLIVGDSVTDYVETTRGIRRAFNGYMDFAGWGTYYTERSDGGNDAILHHYASFSASTDTSYTPGTIFKMANGTTATSVAATGGVLADSLQVYFHGGAALGSILVETQRNGGSWGTRATIVASALPNEYRATNFALTPLTNYNVRFTSTGSNNLANWGLLNTTATTNSHAWAKIANAGNTIANIVTNAGFWTFLTNYNPQIIFVEAKDPVADLVIADAWMKANLTNYDVVWINNAPNLPDSGAAASREFILSTAQTDNDWMVFDKYSYFTPTNYFYSGLPWTAENIWADGAHLGAKGIAYISSAFASWFGVGSDRFAGAGLRPISNSGSSDPAKANLAGGNTFTGTQVISSQLSLGAGAGMFHYDPSGLGGMRIGPTNTQDILRYRSTYDGDKSLFVVSNGFATTNLFMDTDPGYLMTLGANSPFKFKGIGEFSSLNAATGTISGTLSVGSVAGNGAGFTNLPITALQGSGGANSPATNGTAGQALLSAANGGVYWGTAGSGSQTNIVAGFSNGLSGVSISSSNVFEVMTTNATKAIQVGTNGNVMIGNNTNRFTFSNPDNTNATLEIQTASRTTVKTNLSVKADGKYVFAVKSGDEGSGRVRNIVYIGNSMSIAADGIKLYNGNQNDYDLTISRGDNAIYTYFDSPTATTPSFSAAGLGVGGTLYASRNAYLFAPVAGTLVVSNNLSTVGSVIATNGFIANSNSFPFLATNVLASGQIAIGSSAGVPTVVAKDAAGTQTTNALIPVLKLAFSTDYTVVSTDSILACTGTNQLLTLPDAALLPGKSYTFLMSSTTGGGSAIVTNYNGSQTILTAAGLSQTITNGQSLTVVSDAVNWR